MARRRDALQDGLHEPFLRGEHGHRFRNGPGPPVPHPRAPRGHAQHHAAQGRLRRSGHPLFRDGGRGAPAGRGFPPGRGRDHRRRGPRRATRRPSRRPSAIISCSGGGSGTRAARPSPSPCSGSISMTRSSTRRSSWTSSPERRGGSNRPSSTRPRAGNGSSSPSTISRAAPPRSSTSRSCRSSRRNKRRDKRDGRFGSRHPGRRDEANKHGIN